MSIGNTGGTYWSGYTANPYVTRNPDDSLALTWPESDCYVALIAREALQDLTAEISHYRQLIHSGDIAPHLSYPRKADA